MQLVGRWVHPRRRGWALAALVAAWTAAPLTASAFQAPTITTGVLNSAICQVTSLTLSTTLPVYAVPGPDSLGGTPFTLSGAGMCTSPLGTAPLSIQQASGTTAGPASCGAISASDVETTVTIVGISSYQALVSLAGPTANTQLLIQPMLVQPTSGGYGAGQLSISTASLQACLQPGGTTSLQYTGSALIAL